jgi:hypothetical protein
MTIDGLSRSSFVFFCALAAAACSGSSTNGGPDAPPDVNPATDASIVESPDSAGLDAKVQGRPKLAITPATAAFPALCPGQSSTPITFKVGNIGDAGIGPLTVEITGSNAKDFTATPTGCDLLAPGAVCTVAVVFAPQVDSYLPLLAALVVTGPAPDFLTAYAALNASGGGPATLSLTSPTSDLGSVAVGTTGPPVTFTLRNLGGRSCSTGPAQGPFTVTLTDSNAELIITDDTCSTSVLPKDGTCTVGIALRPTSAGSKQALLSLTSSSASVSVMLTGTGIDSAIDASIVSPLDSAVLDTSNEAQGGVDQAG